MALRRAAPPTSPRPPVATADRAAPTTRPSPEQVAAAMLESPADLDEALRLSRAVAPSSYRANEARDERRREDVVQGPRAITAGDPAQKKNDPALDGCYLGGDGKLYPPGTPPREIVALLPTDGKKALGTVLLVNGIMTDPHTHLQDMKALAAQGLAVVGVHNATIGLRKDLGDCVRNKCGAPNPAVETVADYLHGALADGRDVHVVGHSQGALVLARALVTLQSRLILDDGLSPADAKAKLASIHVETHGGAAMRWIDGPAYVHYVNTLDLVPMLAGVGLGRVNPFCRPGEGATIHRFQKAQQPTDLPPARACIATWFARAVDRTVHGPRDVYFKTRLGPGTT